MQRNGRAKPVLSDAAWKFLTRFVMDMDLCGLIDVSGEDAAAVEELLTKRLLRRQVALTARGEELIQRLRRETQ